ncbi:MAG: hypothetical protein AB7E04_08620 [Desulfobacteraceae bacterium]
MKKVLVEGYGDKPGLGWEIVFEQAEKIVFKNKGTGMFVRFDHSVTNYQVFVRAYESMSDIDTGLFPCPAPANENPVFQLVLGASSTSTANICPWRILGDDKGIWVVLNPAAAHAGGIGNNRDSAGWKFVYIGDYISYDISNNQYNFAMCMGDRADYNYELWFCDCATLITTRPYYHIMRIPDRTPGSVKIGISPGTGAFFHKGDYFCYLGDNQNVCDYASDFQLTAIPTIHCGGKLLGRLPGLKNSLSGYGYKQSFLSSYSDTVAKKPEMNFDFGDYNEHFWRMADSSGNFRYMVLTEGKGFRNVI